MAATAYRTQSADAVYRAQFVSEGMWLCLAIWAYVAGVVL
jgi:hypothetical protein